MKTIFIPIFFGHVARNILRTTVLENLLSSGSRVVIFFPRLKEKFYRQEFSHSNLILEPVEFRTDNKRALKMNNLSYLFLNSKTNFIKQKMAAKNLLKYYSKAVLIIFLSSFKIFKKAYYKKYLKVMTDNFFATYFEKYKPDLVFCPHTYGKEDMAMLREAKKRKIKSVAVVNSWDNLSTRGIMRILPDKMIVHNDYMKSEALKWSTMKEKDIKVAGMPHFDYYVNYQPDSKKEFCQKTGLNPDKRFLLFCPPVNSLHWSWKNLLNDLKSEILDGSLPRDLQILVRFAPTDDEDMSQYDLNDPIVKYDKPGKYFNPGAANDWGEGRKDWEFTQEDMRHFANSLYYAELMLNYGSTLNIDGAAFDLPLINIVFDDRTEKGRKFVEWLFIKTHNSKLFSTGGTKLVYNRQELIKAINQYLEDPFLNKAGRKRMIEQQYGPDFDGRAGERMTNFVIQQLNA